MGRKVRLTESDLKRIVLESVKRVICEEFSDETMARASKKASLMGSNQMPNQTDQQRQRKQRQAQYFQKELERRKKNAAATMSQRDYGEYYDRMAQAGKMRYNKEMNRWNDTIPKMDSPSGALPGKRYNRNTGKWETDLNIR